MSVTIPSRTRLQRVKSWLLQDRGAFLFVWACWLILFGVALGFVYRFAMRLPVGDDWTLFVGMLTGDKGLTFNRLWHQDNEHRLPLIRLILWPLIWLTNGEFHIENYLNVVVLAGLAAVLIRAVRRMRGSQSFADAFFPVALLNLGHFEIFAARLTLNHALSTVLMGLVLAILATQRGPLTIRRALVLGGLLFCLPLCGANGIPVVVMTIVWLVVGARVARSEHGCEGRAGVTGLVTPFEDSGRATQSASLGWLRVVHFAIAAILALLLGFYFLDFKKPPHHPAPATVADFARTSGEIMTMTIGHYFTQLWPWTAFVAPAFALLTLPLILGAWWRQPAERGRALGLLLFLAAVFGLALSIAWGRAALGPRLGSAPRYAVVTVPILLAIYLAWVAYGPRRLRMVVQLALLLVLCAVYPFSAELAHVHCAAMRGQERAVAKALAEGAPVAYLAPRASGLLYPPGLTGRAAGWMTGMRGAGVKPFDRLQDEPVWEETPLDLTPAHVHQMTWNGKRWEATGTDPCLTYALSQPQFVHAVRLRFTLKRHDPGLCWMQVFWARQGGYPLLHRRQTATFGFHPTGRKKSLDYDVADKTLLVWVNDTIDQLRIDPDNALCRFQIREITLLRKPAEPDAPARESAR